MENVAKVKCIYEIIKERFPEKADQLSANLKQYVEGDGCADLSPENMILLGEFFNCDVRDCIIIPATEEKEEQGG